MFQIQFFSVNHNQWVLLCKHEERNLDRLIRLFEVLGECSPRKKLRIIDLATGGIIYE